MTSMTPTPASQRTLSNGKAQVYADTNGRQHLVMLDLNGAAMRRLTPDDAGQLGMYLLTAAIEARLIDAAVAQERHLTALYATAQGAFEEMVAQIAPAG
jgi:hypothetical protein